MSKSPKKMRASLTPEQGFEQEKRSAEKHWKQSCSANLSLYRSIDVFEAEAASLMKDNSQTAGVEEAWKSGERLQREAQELRVEAERIHCEAWKNSLHLHQAKQDEKKALELLTKSSDAAKKAHSAYGQIKVLIEQKQEEDRKRELKRIEASNDLNAVKNEAEQYGFDFLADWGGDPAMLEATRKILLDAEGKLASGQFEESRQLSAVAVSNLRILFEKSKENENLVERRNIITKAIVEALKELNYDDPAVRYQPKPGDASENNPKLGDLSIKADTSSGTGNMRFNIHLDGEIELDVQNVMESDCRGRVYALQDRVSDLVDFTVKDWGSGERIPEAGSIKQPEKTKIAEKTVETERSSQQRTPSSKPLEKR